MPSWPALVADDGLSGEGAEYTVGQGLSNRQECVSETGATYRFAEATTSSTSYAVRYSKEIRCPDWALTNSTIRLSILVKVSNNIYTGYFKCSDNATATAGTEQTTTSTTYVALTSVLTIPNDTWAATSRVLEVQTKISSAVGTLSYSGEPVLWNCEFRRP